MHYGATKAIVTMAESSRHFLYLEVYEVPCQKSAMELFCEYIQQLKMLNCFRKNRHRWLKGS